MLEPRPSATDLANAIGVAHARGAAGVAEPEQVIGEVAVVLGKLIGSSGFDVLLARAVKLAARQDAALSGVSSFDGGHLEGLPEGAAERARCVLVLLAHLCELLMKFIGEDLATREFRDAWSLAADEEKRDRRNA